MAAKNKQTHAGAESPCVNICVMHPRAEICAGCYRTAEEINDWMMMSTEDRRAVIADLPSREALLKQRTGRRRKRRADG